MTSNEVLTNIFDEQQFSILSFNMTAKRTFIATHPDSPIKSNRLLPTLTPHSDVYTPDLTHTLPISQSHTQSHIHT